MSLKKSTWRSNGGEKGSSVPLFLWEWKINNMDKIQNDCLYVSGSFSSNSKPE